MFDKQIDKGFINDSFNPDIYGLMKIMRVAVIKCTICICDK
jgi:hypothetical protein